jgi:hypothetical protein
MRDRPISPADAMTAPWWEATKQRRFLLQRCDACGHHQHYPRSICTSCHARDLPYVDASGRGTIYSFSEVHRAPDPAFEPPYLVALVRLEEGPVVMGNVIGGGEVACDAAVVLDWEALPDGRMLPQFRLA